MFAYDPCPLLLSLPLQDLRKTTSSKSPQNFGGCDCWKLWLFPTHIITCVKIIYLCFLCPFFFSFVVDSISFHFTDFVCTICSLCCLFSFHLNHIFHPSLSSNFLYVSRIFRKRILCACMAHMAQFYQHLISLYLYVIAGSLSFCVLFSYNCQNL